MSFFRFFRSMIHWAMAVLLFLTLLPAGAHAHKVIVFAFVEGEEIVTESGFPGGRPCKGCGVAVQDLGSGAVLLEGESGDDGIWRFPLTGAVSAAEQGLEIILDAGEGHRATWRLAPEEYRKAGDSAAAVTSSAVPEQKADAQDPPARPEAPAPTNGQRLQGLDSDALLAAVREEVAEVVSRELAPIKRELRQSREPDLRDILGGIGYIFGLAGLLAYARSRMR
jgi:nickel transport protein